MKTLTAFAMAGLLALGLSSTASAQPGYYGHNHHHHNGYGYGHPYGNYYGGYNGGYRPGVSIVVGAPAVYPRPYGYGGYGYGGYGYGAGIYGLGGYSYSGGTGWYPGCGW